MAHASLSCEWSPQVKNVTDVCFSILGRPLHRLDEDGESIIHGSKLPEDVSVGQALECKALDSHLVVVVEEGGILHVSVMLLLAAVLTHIEVPASHTATSRASCCDAQLTTAFLISIIKE